MKNNSKRKYRRSNVRETLLSILKARFEKNTGRHKGLEWAKVLAKLEAAEKNCGRSMKWK
jgi:hypothetical protein